MKTIKSLVVAIAVACLAQTTAHAETKSDEAKPAANKAQSAAMTDAQLKEMLELLGYDVQEDKSSSNPTYTIKVVRKNLTYTLTVSLSGSKTKLWASSALAELKTEHASQPDKLLKLLELNQKIGPSHFYYYDKFKMIYIAKPMDNRGVTAKLLREHIDELMEQIIANEPFWDVRKWSAVAANKTEK
jgi:hypothetical protein